MVKHVSIDSVNQYLTQPVLGLSGSRTADARRSNDFMWEHEDMFAAYKGFVSGAAIGFDHHGAEFLALRYHKAIHVVIVPSNRSKVKYWWRDSRWEKYAARIYVAEMPQGTTYADRNSQIVSLSSSLLALAEDEEDAQVSKRSGTWQTIRMADRRHRVKPTIGLLNGPDESAVGVA